MIRKPKITKRAEIEENKKVNYKKGEKTFKNVELNKLRKMFCIIKRILKNVLFDVFWQSKIFL